MTSYPSQPLRPFDLSGKVALVTGSNTGLGAGMARALAAAGCDIVGVSRSDDSDTAQQVKALGRRYAGVSADLSDIAPVDDIVRAALEACGRIDVLVNNAGIIRRADALTFSEDDWDAVMNVNLKSAFFLAQAVARHYVEREQRGKIINVASMLSFQGGIRVASYTSSKSGMLGLTRLLANEWAARGINVNAIAPGYMATSNTAALRDDAQRNSEIVARIPAGRWGTPDDLAGPVVFLASPASDYVHGHTLAVDGGWLAR
ncbi:2-dehydro-3-deoxy-D-gluconate 5-dehydrogenase KduD [Paraburkholderia caribensis]|uniref:2-dehydro-3-deoxy-D-gluconate 5-dehydrogenase n=1 Tax=Paraburkholderia caribensis TaxID=75105 RepID=A0A9Q6WQU8_9BURK|nr:2-dehydro-3-deoxy-D-gluconate 5-dehydrogenase KduD [Paraburkholderia caribensis]MCO4877163.1 2-dehydro-3-deoxy-D-gluconate 5-dehydrogenase KduD [Paraburkholderia caribensis]MDR6381062.1 2-deoxy-D-gluconate 3-dehydrogenase [Paraburkholderia caribensis]PTB23430.1 2-deoxy-D-gluconate 3-dehydrogenase [Paraburkholderia caribensis]QLB66961.1 2-deoxy-D-gluconate 3-dehydrogenase [Paraburkholderia caribensis]